MKKLIVFVFVALVSVACLGPAENCPSNSYPLYCDDNDACCPAGWSYSCGGQCYQTYADAWTDCGRFGWYTDSCYYE